MDKQKEIYQRMKSRFAELAGYVPKNDSDIGLKMNTLAKEISDIYSALPQTVEAKAIEILSDFSRQVVAKADGVYERDDFIEAKKVAVIALREQAEREKGCKYCKQGCDLENSSVCEPSLYIRGDELIALRYDERDSEAPICYCPMCGRRLK